MALWSVRYNQVAKEQESVQSVCKVCKAQGQMEVLKEKKVVRIFFIPISSTPLTYKVCPNCAFRLLVKENADLLDANM